MVIMRKKLPPTFPLRLILVVSLILCLCGAGTIILAVFSVKHHTWGYNWGTGFWCGAVTIAAGVCGIISTHARNICSMKTFMISAVFGGVASLVMLALSAGGLDVNSGLYTDTYKPNNMTVIVHGGCLGISILQLILFILADAVCIYYLFVEKKSTIFSLKTTPGNKPTPVLQRESFRRSNNNDNSTAPVYRKPKSKHKNNKKQKHTSRSENIDDIETPLRRSRDRDRLLSSRRQEELPTSSPVRNHVERNSFTTFGHGSVAEQESLIVHPDDDVSTVNSTVRGGSRASTSEENHYAQGLLFEPPIPIEEDDQLPPYEPVDSNPYKVANLATKGSNSSLRRNRNNSGKRDASSSELTKTGDPTNKQRNQKINTRNEIPHGRGDNASAQRSNTDLDAASTTKEPVYAVVQPRRSRSVDLLSEESDSFTADGRLNHPQGVVFKDFARSSDRLIPRSQRSQSLRSVRPTREKRLERRNRALSAEIKLTKDQILSQRDQCYLIKRTGSIDGSNSGLYADNRAMPTKFSLRTPVRQAGAPYIPSVVPIKSISSLPIFRPPPKPPRTHSVTVEDLKSEAEDNAIESKVSTSDINDCVFIDEGASEDEQTTLKTVVNDRSDGVCHTETANENIISQKQITENTIDSKQLPEIGSYAEVRPAAGPDIQKVTSNVVSEMKLQEGPVVSCLTKPPLTKQHSITSVPVGDTSNAGSKSKTENSNGIAKDADVETKTQPEKKESPLSLKPSENISDTKEGIKINTPVPKTRTSIKSSKTPDGRSKLDSEPFVKKKENLTDDSNSAAKNDKTEDKVEQSQLNKDDFSVLKVKLPPLKQLSIGSTSPSLRIINRKMPKKETDEKTEQSHEITNTVTENVHVAFKSSPDIVISRSRSVEYKGARPKTTPRTFHSMSDKSRALPFSNRNLAQQDKNSSHRKDDSNKIEGSKTHLSVLPQISQSVQKQPLLSRSHTNIKSSESGNTNRRLASGRNGFEFNSNPSIPPSNSVNSSMSTPARTTSAAGATGYSQGVLHLPQTQFARQVSASDAQGSGTNSVNNNNVPVAAQNQGNQQNSNTDRLLIAKLL